MADEEIPPELEFLDNAIAGKAPTEEQPLAAAPAAAPAGRELPSVSASAKVVLGPVVGKVTETEARILMEVDEPCEIILEAQGAERALILPSCPGHLWPAQ